MKNTFEITYATRAFCICILSVLFLALSTGIEYGALANNSSNSTTQIQNVLCNAVNQLTGGIGRAISIIIIISTAFMLFLGKITWGLGIMIAVAMGLLFGAGSIVNLLAGGGTASC